jgi:hypothetical protein
MARAVGPILRRTGLLIELLSIAGLVGWDHQGRTIAGIPARHLLIAGVSVGFVLWAVGLALILRAARGSRTP